MIKSFIQFFIPPQSWRVPVIILLGILAGLFASLFYISKAHSYLSDAPETCTNCHIMAPQYATWNHSSHREVANCNDCHVPHNNFLNKYYFKAKDGMRHATIFTLRAEPEVIFIKKEGQEVVHQNCIRCHENQLMNPKMMAQIQNLKSDREERKCWECHQEVPHGKVNSISSVPNAIVPLPESPVPEWLKGKLRVKSDE